MNLNSKAIVILCSHLCVGENVKPYEPTEWAKFAERLKNVNIEPHEVLSFSNDDFKSKFDFGTDEISRINRLIERSGSIAFEVERYANIGVNIMTRADECYPKVLKQKLGKSCPPIFYYAGDPALAGKKCMGVVGSRNICADDEMFTVKTVEKSSSEGLAIVSGGAKGVDSVAQAHAIETGNFCIEYISDSLIKKIKQKNIVGAVLGGRLLILSVAKPDAGFFTGFAMMRNKYIYSQADYTVVVKSDYNKGGTWAGAVDNLKKPKSVTYCWNNPKYEGNMALINKGAIPINDEWDVDFSAYSINHDIAKPEAELEQLSLFAS